ncbi:DUF4349 domain-containing protein [Leptospira sp. 96542]|nr:DUF4349 domain-containing protein [Leptospira sp. 96542]
MKLGFDSAWLSNVSGLLLKLGFDNAWLSNVSGILLKLGFDRAWLSNVSGLLLKLSFDSAWLSNVSGILLKLGFDRAWLSNVSGILLKLGFDRAWLSNVSGILLKLGFDRAWLSNVSGILLKLSFDNAWLSNVSGLLLKLSFDSDLPSIWARIPELNNFFVKKSKSVTFFFMFIFRLPFLFLVLSLSISNCTSTRMQMEEERSHSEDSPKNMSMSAVGREPTPAPGNPKGNTEQMPVKRMMVYSVTVNLQAKDIEPKVTEVIQLAESFGGYTLQHNSNGNVQLKIPADKLRAFLQSLKHSSQNYSEEVSAKDVTEEFTDTEIRLENAQKMRIRLLEILKSAKNLEETLKVEAELNKISENIERFEGRLKYLSSVIQFSSVQVYVRKKWEPTVTREYKPGPLGYPFYYTYIGLGYLVDGIVWLFVQEIPKEQPNIN